MGIPLSLSLLLTTINISSYLSSSLFLSLSLSLSLSLLLFAVSTVRRGGSCLLPIQTGSAAALDLLEHVCASLISEVLLDVVVYVISPAAARWLATANRMVEWYAAPLDLQ